MKNIGRENKFEQDACHLPLMILRLRKDPQIVYLKRPPCLAGDVVANRKGGRTAFMCVRPTEDPLPPPFFLLDFPTSNPFLPELLSMCVRPTGDPPFLLFRLRWCHLSPSPLWLCGALPVPFFSHPKDCCAVKVKYHNIASAASASLA